MTGPYAGAISVETKPRVHRINGTDPEHMQGAARAGHPWFVILGFTLVDDGTIISHWGMVHTTWQGAMLTANHQAFVRSRLDPR